MNLSSDRQMLVSQSTNRVQFQKSVAYAVVLALGQFCDTIFSYLA